MLLKFLALLFFCCTLRVRALPVAPGEILEEKIKKLPRLQDDSFDSVLKINDKSESQFFEGDILLPVGRNAMQAKDMRWGSTIPYEISASYSYESEILIVAVLRELEVRTCFKFVKRTNQANYMYFAEGDGCYSSVGMVGGEQIISIGGGCDNHRTIMHETFHALGFWHEQSRTDRDDWVKIVYDNITPGQEYNFDKYDSDKVDLMGMPYDYDSVMHYSSTAFTKNGSHTIIPLKEGGENMGRIDEISEIDLAEVNKLYECQETLDSNGYTQWTEWSNCSTQCEATRERYCDGSQCSEFGKRETQVTGCQDCVIGYDPDCGPANLTSPTGDISSPLFPHYYKVNAECTQTITVPVGSRIKLFFLVMDVEHFNEDCYYDFLDIFDGSDDQAAPLGEFCGTLLPPTLYSSGNSMTIKFRSDDSVNKNGFFAKYYTVYGPAHMCTFDDGDHFCGWEIDPTGDVPLSFMRGETPSADTGPLMDHTFGTSIGGYLFLEASSPTASSNKARLISPFYGPLEGGFCFSMWYNMYGINTGTLTAYVEIDGMLNPMFSYVGDTRSREWFRASQNIKTTSQFKIVIELTRYNGYMGDIAIDDVMLNEGPCPTG